MSERVAQEATATRPLTAAPASSYTPQNFRRAAFQLQSAAFSRPRILPRHSPDKHGVEILIEKLLSLTALIKNHATANEAGT